MKKWTLIALALDLGQAQGSLDQEIFGSTPVVMEPKKIQETLTIGGKLEFAGSTELRQGERLGHGTLGFSKKADLFLDGRPRDELRGYLGLRLKEDPLEKGLKSQLDELWFRWNWDRKVFFTAGKQHLKWGSGRIWNPTDFLAISPKDPFALNDLRLGRDLFKVHLPQEATGANLYLIADFEDTVRQDDVGGALRGELPFAGVGEAALTLRARKGTPFQGGLDVSSGLGPLDLYTELAFSRPGFQGVFGLSHSLSLENQASITFGGEYFYNEGGTGDRVKELTGLLLGTLKPLSAGRRYVGAYGSYQKQDLSFYLNGIANLSDGTQTVRATGTYTLYKDMVFEAFLGRAFGAYGEFAFGVPDSYRTQKDPLLEEKIAKIPTALPRYTLGLGVSLKV
jgi:hypothetical protein